MQRISEARDELAAVDERLVGVVDLKCFGGYSFIEIAAMMSVSERTIQRDWEKARLFALKPVPRRQLRDRDLNRGRLQQLRDSRETLSVR